MPCKYCNVSFSLIKWKNKCQDCMCYVCTSCIVHKKCLPCYHVLRSQLQFETLMKLKVKDLKLYSNARGFPVGLCREKHELVQIILQHSNVDGRRQQSVQQHLDTNTEQSAAHLSNYASGASYPRQPPSTVSGHEEASSNTKAKQTHGGAAEASGETEREPAASTHTDESFVEPEQPLPTPRPIPTGIGNKLLIADITCIAQIEDLTSREMKQILVDNFVDYKGCVEKSELQTRVKNLYSDREKNEKRMAQDEAEAIGNDNETCTICWDRAIDCVLLECGHMATCTSCGKRLNQCPICRQFVVRCVHVFRS